MDRAHEISKMFILSLGNKFELKSAPRSQPVRPSEHGPLNQPRSYTSFYLLQQKGWIIMLWVATPNMHFLTLLVMQPSLLKMVLSSSCFFPVNQLSEDSLNSIYTSKNVLREHKQNTNQTVWELKRQLKIPIYFISCI